MWIILDTIGFIILIIKIVVEVQFEIKLNWMN